MRKSGSGLSLKTENTELHHGAGTLKRIVSLICWLIMLEFGHPNIGPFLMVRRKPNTETANSTKYKVGSSGACTHLNKNVAPACPACLE